MIRGVEAVSIELDNSKLQLLTLADRREAPLNRAVYSLARRVEVEGLNPHPRWLEGLLDP